MPVATNATIMPTIKSTITTGRARRHIHGGITRGRVGGASMLIVPWRVAGGGSRRRASKISRLIGSPPALRYDWVGNLAPGRRGRAARRHVTTSGRARTTTAPTTGSESAAGSGQGPQQFYRG